MSTKTTISLEELHRELDKKLGVTLKTAADLKPRTYRGSGSIALDVALGGGWGKRSVVQLMGVEGSGKTLLFDLAAIEAQQVEGKKSLIFDFEGTYDKRRFELLGGDPSMLDVIDHGSVGKLPMLFIETAFDIFKIVARTDTYACICFDSTGAMVTLAAYEKKEKEGQDASTPFGIAKTMSEGLAIATGLISRSPSEPTVFFVSQGRDNIGARSFNGIPAEDKQTGGRALPFYASTRVKVRKGETYKGDIDGGEKDVEVGHVTKVTVKKNKCNGVQGRTALFDIYHAGGIYGIDKIDELVKLSTFVGTVEKSGGWLKFNGESMREAELKERLADSETYRTLYASTREALARAMDTSTSPDEDDDGSDE